VSISIFEVENMHERMTDKTTQPSDADMINVIGQPIADAWTSLCCFLMETYECSIINSVDSDGWESSAPYRRAAYAK
jgi:hypothetical protein